MPISGRNFEITSPPEPGFGCATSRSGTGEKLP
jgi:hypothetical protein